MVTEERDLTGERFKAYSVADFVGQCRMQARDNLDPEYSAFMSALAAKLEQLEKATRGAGHALRSYQYGNASTELAEACATECEAALAVSN
ncbi:MULTISPECIES: hypothetical protein [unclassified Xanthobacter]|uniref:hypothetical protein n=1 Tax=unclassified Xanthobacter TaxID=2623496 RepID=UPI001F2B4189|nr:MULTISPECIES: hypothetical protein [unclassified Xanthobacter]